MCTVFAEYSGLNQKKFVIFIILVVTIPTDLNEEITKIYAPTFSLYYPCKL